MTRDEAIALSIQHRAGEANRSPNQVKALHINAARRIDSYVALGMLKLDEPKDNIGVFLRELQSNGWQIRDEKDRDDIRVALNVAGLKIVEK